MASAGRRRAGKNLHTNVRALALQQNPGFCSVTGSGKGKCSSRIHVDQGALSRYVEDHLEQLTLDAERARVEARKQRRAVLSEIPLSNQDWLRWLDANEHFFQERLNSAHRERRGLNVRVEPGRG